MPTKQALWQLVTSSPLIQLAAIVTIFVGLLSIIKDIGKLIMGGWNQLVRVFNWYGDRKLLQFLKAASPSALFEVKDLAEAMHRRPAKIAESLRRLKEKHKVRCMNVEESPFGLWGLHEHEF